MKNTAPALFSVNKTFCGVLFVLTTVTACTQTTTTETQNDKKTAANSTSAQCSKDTDCKGDRICDKGVCAAPTETKIASSTSQTVTKANNPQLNDKTALASSQKGFTPYAGKWYFVDSVTNKKDEQRAPNVVSPDNTQAIAGLRKNCGQAFTYTFTPMIGKAIQENIQEGIKSVEYQLQNQLADNKKADDNNPGRNTYIATLKSDIEMAYSLKQKFNPNKEYWSHTYACGDASRDTYYVSPNQAITLEYAGGETQLNKTIR